MEENDLNKMDSSRTKMPTSTTGLNYLHQAEKYYVTSEKFFNKEMYFLACYFAWYSARFSFESFLYFNGRSIRINHSLIYLCKIAESVDKKFKTLRKSVSILDAFYFSANLTDSIFVEEYSKKHLKEILSTSDHILDFVKKRIPTPEEKVKF